MESYLKITSPTGGSRNANLERAIIYIGEHKAIIKEWREYYIEKHYASLKELSEEERNKKKKDYFKCGVKIIAKLFGRFCNNAILYMIEPKIIKNSKNRQWYYNKRTYAEAFGYVICFLKEFLDAFDNEIVYYTLISESYCSMLAEALASKEAHASAIPEDMIHFYYIQASYYFQKTITELSSINNIADKVLSSNANDVIEKKLISLPRYKNVKKLLEIIYNDIETNKSLIKGLDTNELIIELNKNSRNLLDKIDRAVSISLRPCS